MYKQIVINELRDLFHFCLQELEINFVVLGIMDVGL